MKDTPPPRLSPTTVLQRAPDLELRLAGPDSIEIVAKGEWRRAPGSVLRVLDVFAEAKPLSEAVAQLQARGQTALEWIELTGIIRELWQGGVLCGAESADHQSLEASGYGSPRIHVEMLDDHQRTATYLKAIRAIVRPGDVVLDLGTGTGVLAAAAAQAGASRVYAIEATGIGAAAQRLWEANRLDDRITLIRGWSTRVDLPERVDVMISELIGNDPLGERMLDLTEDARKRFLKPGARMIPEGVRIFAVPVAVPSAWLAKRVFTAEAAAAWSQEYGIDFCSLAREPLREGHSLWLQPTEARDWPTAAAPVAVFSADMRSATFSSAEVLRPVQAERSLRVNGVLEFFEAELAPGVTLSVNPATAAESNHWRLRLVPLQNPLEVRAGDWLEMYYRQGVPGRRDTIEVRLPNENALEQHAEYPR